MVAARRWSPPSPMEYYKLVYTVNGRACQAFIYGDYVNAVKVAERVRSRGFRCLIDVTPRKGKQH